MGVWVVAGNSSLGRPSLRFNAPNDPPTAPPSVLSSRGVLVSTFLPPNMSESFPSFPPYLTWVVCFYAPNMSHTVSSSFPLLYVAPPDCMFLRLKHVNFFPSLLPSPFRGARLYVSALQSCQQLLLPAFLSRAGPSFLLLKVSPTSPPPPVSPPLLHRLWPTHSIPVLSAEVRPLIGG